MSDYKVFYSWQSDLDPNSTRSFIRECIDEAIDLASDTETIEAMRDEATLNVTGSPNIVSTLFSKIDDCDMFIADVNCCYYGSNKNGKRSPNPNVMLELGYAAKTIGWERILCICSSESVELLPFDIAQNRVTSYSFCDKHSRKEEKHRIAKIIFKNIRALKEEPMTKKGSSLFIVGSYNNVSMAVNKKLVPVDFKDKSCYAANNEIIAKRIRELVSEINCLNLSKEKTIKDSQSQTVSALLKMRPIIISESEEIKRNLMLLLDIGVTDVFFDVGNLARGLPLPSFFGESLEGSEVEKEKYYKLCLLAEALKMYQARIQYPESFNEFCYIPIAIQNISKIPDEDIRIVIQAQKGTLINPYDTPLPGDNSEFCGFLCESYDGISAIRDLFGLLEDGIIHAEGPYNPCTILKTPILQEWLGESVKDEATYYSELETYIEEPFDERYYDFEITKLRPNECKWTGRGMLIKPDNGEIILNYHIYSSHSTGEIKGTLSLAV